MAELLAAIGGVAAGVQLVEFAAQALLQSVKFIRNLQDIPKRVSLILDDIEKSADRIKRFCATSLHPKSVILSQLDEIHYNCLVDSTIVLRDTMDNIRFSLKPLVDWNTNKFNKIKFILRLRRGMGYLAMEKQISDRLRRLDRLNIELARDLGLVGLGISARSSQALSRILMQLDKSSADSRSFGGQAGTASPEGHVSTAKAPLSFPHNQDHVQRSGDNSDTIDTIVCEGREQLRQHRSVPSGDSTSNFNGLGRPLEGWASDSILEFVLFTMRTFYTIGNLDTVSLVVQTSFWEDVACGIYAFKVLDPRRGHRILENCSAAACGAFPGGLPVLLIETFSTLSPVNTATCPSNVQRLIQRLSCLASEQLTSQHPICLVLQHLDENYNKEIALRALQYVTDRLGQILGPVHELSLLAQRRLIAFLRRSGDLRQASQVCLSAMKSTRTAFGRESPQERQISRQLEHIYMEMEDWSSALCIGYAIVGQRLDGVTQPILDPFYHDKCAVRTMEDISKIYETLGRQDEALSWLKQARISGGIGCGDTAETVYVQEKLNKHLRESGKGEETRIWCTLDALDDSV